MREFRGSGGNIMAIYNDDGSVYKYATLTGQLKEPFSELCRQSLQHGSDKAGNGYTEYYWNLWEPIRNEVNSVLELGVSGGGSVKMWEWMFPNARVVGLDNGLHETKPAELNTSRIKIVRGDQTSVDDLMECVSQCGGEIDIVIDDASHQHHDQQWSMSQLLPYVRAGGYYVIEDIAASDWGASCIDQTTRKVLADYIVSGVFRSPYLSELENIAMSEQVASAHYHYGNYEETGRQYADIDPMTWAGGILCMLRKI